MAAMATLSYERRGGQGVGYGFADAAASEG